MLSLPNLFYHQKMKKMINIFIFRRFVSILLILCLLCFAHDPAMAQTQLRIASWNLADLWHVEGELLRPPLPGRKKYPRRAQDFALLAAYGARLAADLIALQEIGSPQAARKIFPESEYHLLMSKRYQEQRAQNQPRDIYNAIAIRKNGKLQILKQQYYAPLAIAHYADDMTSYQMRGGVAVQLQMGDLVFWFLSIHLKSGCPNIFQSLFSPQKAACATLAQQTVALERWIDRHHAKGEYYVVGGDFNRYLAYEKKLRSGYVKRDQLFTTLNDGHPKNFGPQKGEKLRLLRFPNVAGNHTDCIVRHSEPARDYILLPVQLLSFVEITQTGQINYSQIPADKPRSDLWTSRLSDHCPIFLDLTLRQ